MEVINGILGIMAFGLILTYIGMGIVQPIGAICRLIATKRMDSQYAIGLKKYLLSVIVYFFLLAIIYERLQKHGWEAINLIYLFIVPLFYAIWYICHTRKWRKKNNNIKAYDQLLKLKAPNKDRLLLDSFPKKKIKYQYPNYSQLSIKLHKKHAVIRSLPNTIQVK